MTTTADVDLLPDPDQTGSGRDVQAARGSSLGRYLAVRFLLIFPTVFVLVTIVFFLMRVTGDPISAAFADRLTPEQLQVRLHAAGYDRPLIVQYLEFLKQVVTFDFGRTATDHLTLGQLLRTYGTATLELSLYALVVALVIGLPLGALAAYRRDRAVDAGVRLFAVLAYATPVFFVGLLLKLVLSVKFGAFPVAGRASTATQLALGNRTGGTGIYLIDALRSGDWSLVGDVARHAVLPALALGLLVTGVIIRLVRTNLIGTLSADYVDAARSRGVRERRLVIWHAGRPALIPVITVIGLQIASLLEGAVLTETTFEWRGLGYQLAHYLVARDYVGVQEIVTLITIVVAVTNFLVDAVAALVDPRVRH